MPESEVHYVAIFLDDSSRRRLLERAPPRHLRVMADHVTLCYRPSTRALEQFSIGERVEFEIVGCASDDCGQAALVRGVRSENLIPHVTISCALDVSPVYSIGLLGGGAVEYFSEPLRLSGTVNTFPRR